MINYNPRTLAFAMLIAALPVGFAFAGGSGGRGGAVGAGVGAAGMGSAAIGGGASGGQVGGGPPAGLVGGGSPNSNSPDGNGSAGTGNPSLNAVGGSPGRKWQQYTGNSKRKDRWKRHRGWCGRPVPVPVRIAWWYPARGLKQPTPIHR